MSTKKSFCGPTQSFLLGTYLRVELLGHRPGTGAPTALRARPGRAALRSAVLW